MIAVVWWQAILDFLGSALAWVYSVIPNYGIAIVVLTLLIRIVLLPLAVKQIRSMHAMQAIQPRLKEVQRKYKGDRQKQYEETQKIYKEYGYNPLSGCLPMLLQFPVLIALFYVLRVPGGIAHIPHETLPNGQLPAPGPGNSRLYNDIATQSPNIHLLGANLLCTTLQAGHQVPVTLKAGEQSALVEKNAKGQPVLDCGHGIPVRIPFYALAFLMIGSQWYQQRQMTKASPPGGSTQQQQLTKFMPILFGIWGFIFPAGLVVYWTTSNLVQIGQQHFMLPKAGAGQPEAAGGDGARGAGGGSAGRGGTTGGRRARGASQQRRPDQQGQRGQPSKGSEPGKGSRRNPLEGLRGREGGPAPGSSAGSGGSRPPGEGPGPARGTGGAGSGSGGGGGRRGGDRKKRRKR